ARGRVDRAVRRPHAWARCEGTRGEVARPRSRGHDGPRDNRGDGTRGLPTKEAAAVGAREHANGGGPAPIGARASLMSPAAPADRKWPSNDCSFGPDVRATRIPNS